MSSGNKEIWKKIEDYDYIVSNLRGNIFKNGKLKIYQMQ